MKQLIKDFIEMMEEDFNEAKEAYALTPSSNYWSGAINEFQRIVESHEYCALKSLVQESSNIIPLQPKKQSLLDYMDEIEGYKGEILPKDARNKRNLVKIISEYLEAK